MLHSSLRCTAATLVTAALLTTATGTFAADYYVSPAGSDGAIGSLSEPWETIQHAADTVQPGDTVYVRAGTYEEAVRIETDGTAQSPVVFTAYNDETVILEGRNITLPDWGALLWVNNASYVTVSGFRVEHTGPHARNAGIFVTSSQHVVVEDNETYDTLSSGIGVWTSEDIIVRHNDIELACNDGSQECITIGATDGFEVAYNEVHHGGPGTNGGEGIDAKAGAQNGRIYGNVVHDISRVGIYVDCYEGDNHDIDVFSNVVYGLNAHAFAVANEAGGTLERVRFFNNVAYDNDVGLTIADWGMPSVSHGMRDITIANNTFVRNGDWGGGILLLNAEAQNVTIRNNLLSQNGEFQLALAATPPGLVVDHNFIDGFRGYSTEVRGDDFIEGDPLFAAAATNDFHLLVGSPAIDAASAELAPDTDFDGYGRPAGAAFDMGAFEFGAEPTGGGGAGGSGGTAGSGGSGGSGGSSGLGGAMPGTDDSVDDDGGCGCRMLPTAPQTRAAWWLLGLAALCVRHRRRSG